MMRYIFLFLFCCVQFFAHSQREPTVNIELLSNANDYNQGRLSYNEVWGYEDLNGRKYAILGSRDGTVIYDITSLETPLEVAFVPGARSIWRDMKFFGNYIYIVADSGSDGIVIVDMGQAPQEITWKQWTPTLQAGNDLRQLQKCHNLYIDEQGIAFVSGCNINGGGVLMFDVTQNPDTGVPVYLGPAALGRYSHDNFARGDTLYSADLNSGFFSITDVSDKSNPVLLATQSTSRNFTHNAWLSDDGDYLFTTDEKSNAYVDAYDISDLGNIKRIDRYRPISTDGNGVVPHNVHYFNGYLVISYYSDGVKIVDAHRPENMIEVGAYDTNDDIGAGDGCWGAYPYFADGIILASDMDNGLFVLQADYQRAAYLEGLVRDAENGAPLAGVKVEILSDDFNLESSGPDGVFRTGQLTSGVFNVRFSKETYVDQIVEATMVGGSVALLEVSMERIPMLQLSGNIVRKDDQLGIAGAIRLEGEEGQYEFFANEAGQFEFSATEGFYTVYAGAWGYQQKVIENISLSMLQGMTIELEAGYEDDFILDLGWQVSGDASSGAWVREEPIGTNSGGVANPASDLADDLGDFCYVTGNGEGTSAGSFDVDNGTTFLISPPMDLSDFQDPILSYASWYFDDGGNPNPNDTLEISISNGTDTIVLEKIYTYTGVWEKVDFSLKDLIGLTNNMSLIIKISDFINTPHLVEAGLDGFQVREQMATSTASNLAPEWSVNIFPNPFQDQFRLVLNRSGNQAFRSVRLLNQMGQEVSRWNAEGLSDYLDIHLSVPPGLYLLEVVDQQYRRQVRKVVKQ